MRTEDWAEYQEEIADYFRKLGCIASVNKIVAGARGEHAVDVLVEFDKFGLKNKWAIECKYWKRKVNKEKVMALKSIVEDSGFERGVIITEVGFQKGAQKAATATNILLTTFQDFLKITKKEFIDTVLKKFLENLKDIKERLFHIENKYAEHKRVPLGNGQSSYSSTIYCPKECLQFSGHICVLVDSIDSALRDKLPVIIRFEGDRAVLATSKEDLISFLDKSFISFQRQAEDMIQKIEIYGQKKLKEKGAT